jgi:hypothetical protein
MTDALPPDLARIVSTGDALGHVHRQFVGKAGQLRIPMTDPVGLRASATALRLLASRLEVLSHEKRDAGLVMMAAKIAIMQTQRALTPGYKPRHVVDD